MKLAIAYECIEIKTAKRAVLNNIKWLKARIDTLDPACPVAQKMLGFYTNKLNTQKIVLEWLHENATTSLPNMQSLKKVS